ncbi:MAG: PAS domain S-box protein [bacterium]|nr:PAS domain S-box protein [bacterium]
MSDTTPETNTVKNTGGGVFRKLSIKRKLVIIIMVVASAAMLLAGMAFITYQWREFRDRMETQLWAQAEMVAENCTGSISFNDPEDAEAILASLKAIKPIALVCVYNDKKTPFAVYQRSDFIGKAPPVPKKETSEFAGDWLKMSKHIMLDNAKIGTLYLQADLKQLSQFLFTSVTVLLLMSLVVALFAYLLATKLQQVISTPIFHLAEVAGNVSKSKDYTVRATKYSQDEFGRLTDAINDMLGQVEKRDQALRKSEERFQAIANYTYDWENWQGTDGRLLWTNPAVERLTGYTIEECMEMDDYPLPIVHEDDKKNITKLIHKAASEGTIGSDVRFRLRCKDDAFRWMTISWQPIYSSDGVCLGFRSSIRDITPRKEAEDELFRLRNLLSNIVNSMPSVLVGVDGDSRVTQWNLEAEKATGLSAAEAQGRSLNDVFPQLSGEMEKVRMAIRNRVAQKDEKIISEKDGETRFADVTVYPLIDNGVEGAVIRIDDVTDRVRIEEMMIQSEKMLSVGGLAAGMAHEINNPLAGILQNVQVMYNRIKGKLPKNQHTAEECGTSMEAIGAYMEKRGLLSMIESIMESGRRAAKIVDNMLSFSRKSESRFEMCSLAVLLDKTIDLASNDYDLKKKYDFRKIDLIRQYDDSAPKVPCESSKIQQVFLNLLKNGAQAMAESKKEDEISHFTLRVIPDENRVRVEIEDNGPGMEESVRKRVFEPFFTTKGVGVGTGLGLSVSYFIVTENHKGTMTVESEMGKGTTFAICLPISNTKE